jgi:hypothetical protein
MTNDLPKKAGRPKGATARTTRESRAAIAKFVDSSIPHFVDWLEQVARGIPKTNRAGEFVRDSDGAVVWVNKPDPATAMKLVSEVCEYHLPKLSRQDVQMTGVVANLDVDSLTAHDLAQMSLSDLKRLALEQFQHAAQRGDTIDVEAEKVVQTDVVVEPLPSWLEST